MSNCLIYALYVRFTEGGTLWCELSNSRICRIRIIHFYVLKNGIRKEYVPVRRIERKLFPRVLFRGIRKETNE